MASEPTPSPARPILTDAAREAAANELKFHRDRIAAGSDVVTTIGQYIFLLAGAGVIASSQVRELVVIVPLFWTAWMLHAMQRTRDTIKHEVLARKLEELLNDAVGYPVHTWNLALTSGGTLDNGKGGKLLTLLPSHLNYTYWTSLNITSWIISIVVLFRTHRAVLAIILIATAIVVYTGAAYWWATNEAFRRKCDKVAQAQIDAALQARQLG